LVFQEVSVSSFTSRITAVSMTGIVGHGGGMATLQQPSPKQDPFGPMTWKGLLEVHERRSGYGLTWYDMEDLTFQPTPMRSSRGDEGMTNGSSIFAYLVFGPGRVSLERLSRPIKAMV
jgi:hypothetical protein